MTKCFDRSGLNGRPVAVGRRNCPAHSSRRKVGLAQGLSLLIAPLLLAGCGGGTGGGKPSGDGNSRAVPCGTDPAALRDSCQLEVEDRAGTLHLVLRQPDGGFRRLIWPKGGALAPADGAEPMETTALDRGGVEVRIGGWRYRIERSGGGLP